MPVLKQHSYHQTHQPVDGVTCGRPRYHQEKRYCRGSLSLGLLLAGSVLLFAALGCDDPITPYSRIDHCNNLEDMVVSAEGLVERRVAEFAFHEECIRTNTTPEDPTDQRDRRPEVEDNEGDDVGR